MSNPRIRPETAVTLFPVQTERNVLRDAVKAASVEIAALQQRLRELEGAGGDAAPAGAE